MTTDIARRQRRAKEAERNLGRHLIENDGPDPRILPGHGIASTTGRVGMITALRYDVASRTYAAESKLVKMPAILYSWWQLICQVARDAGKEPLLRWQPSNEDARGVEPMIVITQSRHAELLGYESAARQKQDSVAPTPESPHLASLASQVGAARPYSKESQLGRSPKKGRSK